MNDESKVSYLWDRQAVQDAVNELFLATDLKAWDRVRSIFTDEVHFDMTSLAGGEPATLTPEAIVTAWREGLAEVEQVHHQTGNFVISIDGDAADVSCYGTATHVRADGGLTTFIGSYELGLGRDGSGWRIDRFRFVKKYAG
jgi:hypothetical protein